MLKNVRPFKPQPPAEGVLSEEDFHGKAFSLNYLTTLVPNERLVYVMQHETEIASLSDKQKDRVATLLCHASSEESRNESPIISDVRPNKPQEKFDKWAPTIGAEKASDLARQAERV